MAGTIELYKNSSGECRFRLQTTNGPIIATGEGYICTARALKGIETVRKIAQSADVDNRTA